MRSIRWAADVDVWSRGKPVFKLTKKLERNYVSIKYHISGPHANRNSIAVWICADLSKSGCNTNVF